MCCVLSSCVMYIVWLRRFTSAGFCMILLRASSSIWTARHSSLTWHVRTKPETRSNFPQRRANGNEHSEHLLQCQDAKASASIQAHPIIYIIYILHVCGHGKYDGSWHIGIGSGKKSNLAFGQECPSLQARCLETIPIQGEKHLEHDEMQCKTGVTNTLRTEFSL